MTRIIAGAAGGIRLDVPSVGTRPTSDLVRESLFNALSAGDHLEGTRVLDLYAGSGAVGLEALSRGAASVDFVENNRKAAAIIKRNAARVAPNISHEHEIKVHEQDARTYLSRAKGPFDLVFSDPPYELDDASVDANLLAISALLAPGAIVIVERARRSAAPSFEAAGLTALRNQMYGDTVLGWAEAPEVS